MTTMISFWFHSLNRNLSLKNIFVIRFRSEVNKFKLQIFILVATIVTVEDDFRNYFELLRHTKTSCEVKNNNNMFSAFISELEPVLGPV